MSPGLVLWDWNGTLFDDVKISLDAVNLMLKREELPEITLTQYYSYVDAPIIKFYEHILDLDKIPFPRISEEFRRDYAALADKAVLNDGAPELLEYFRSLGIKQAIISSSHISMLEPYIKKFGIGNYFDAVLAAKDYEAGSKADRAVDYIKKTGINSSECILIGDSLNDVDTANAVGARCFLTCQGHQSKVQFDAAGFTNYFKTLTDIKEQIL